MIRPKNAFLRSLSDSAYSLLRPQLESVWLGLGSRLAREEEPVSSVYFPLTSLISMISTSATGESVESSMVGNEGVAGLTEACGSQIAASDFVVQVDGKALRAPANVVRDLALCDPSFAASAWRLAELQLLESRQSTLCQAMHRLDRRLPRWLLESQDRTAGRNPLPMTQSFLGAMLGVQRTSLTAMALQLQVRGSISYTRGKLELIDTAHLEESACLCRNTMVLHRARLCLKAVASVDDFAPVHAGAR